MIKTVICYNVPGFVVVFYNRVVCMDVYYILVLIDHYTFILFYDIFFIKLFFLHSGILP